MGNKIKTAKDKSLKEKMQHFLSIGEGECGREFSYREIQEMSDLIEKIEDVKSPSPLESQFMISWYLARMRFNEFQSQEEESVFCDACECDPCDCGWGTL